MVDSFLSSHDQGYFILEAEAGFGKTTFLAWLVRERNYILNFCELTPGELNIETALRNLASQLVSKCNLSSEDVLPIDVNRRLNYLSEILKRAVEQRSNDEKIVLVIDALDVAGTPMGQNVLGLPQTLPQNVFIIISQSPVVVTLYIDAAVTPRVVCSLSDYQKENNDDVRSFLIEAAKRPKIAAILKDRNYSMEKFVSSLIERSQGLWIYLHYIIPEIESSSRSTFDLDSLPKGLFSYYFKYWDGLRNTDHNKWSKSYRPLLATLASWVSSEKSEPEDLPRLLNEKWRSYIYFNNEQKRYRFYHQTLQDFFSGKVTRENLTAAEKSFLDELEQATYDAHNHLVEYYLNDKWGGFGDGLPRLQNPENLTIDNGYGLRYLASHLEASDRIDDLNHLLSLEIL